MMSPPPPHLTKPESEPDHGSNLSGLIDISMTVAPGMLHWPGTTSPEMRWESRLADGDGADVSCWTLGAHQGTHIDAPSHFLPGGPTVEGIDPGRLIGPVVVVDLGHLDRPVCAADLRPHCPPGTERVLLLTRNSQRLGAPFDPGYVALDLSGAEFLVTLGVVCVGIDYLSIERPEGGGQVHRRLLGEGVVIIEGLDLSRVPVPSGGAAGYWLCCLPLRLAGGEGAPARAVLLPPGSAAVPSGVERGTW